MNPCLLQFNGHLSGELRDFDNEGGRFILKPFYSFHLLNSELSGYFHRLEFFVGEASP